MSRLEIDSDFIKAQEACLPCVKIYVDSAATLKGEVPEPVREDFEKQEDYDRAVDAYEAQTIPVAATARILLAAFTHHRKENSDTPWPNPWDDKEIDLLSNFTFERKIMWRMRLEVESRIREISGEDAPNISTDELSSSQICGDDIWDEFYSSGWLAKDNEFVVGRADFNGDRVYRKKPCSLCHGKNSVQTCPKCGGKKQFKLTCPICHGTGIKPCHMCMGTGKNKWKSWNDEVECKYCNGTGKEVCSTCSGSGIAFDQECGVCGGTGKVACERCDGEGWLAERFDLQETKKEFSEGTLRVPKTLPDVFDSLDEDRPLTIDTWKSTFGWDKVFSITVGGKPADNINLSKLNPISGDLALTPSAQLKLSLHSEEEIDKVFKELESSIQDQKAAWRSHKKSLFEISNPRDRRQTITFLQFRGIMKCQWDFAGKHYTGWCNLGNLDVEIEGFTSNREPSAW